MDTSGWGMFARVRFVKDKRIYVQRPNGDVGHVTTNDPVDYAPGTPILIFSDRIEEAPEEVWSHENWVAVVRIKNDDVTVIDVAGQPRIIPTTNIGYRIGNTVEATPAGVLRVLDTKPIRLLDMQEVGDDDIKRFIFRPDAAAELTFDDFGGLQAVVDRARELIEAPLLYRDALNKMRARSIKGVLFTGEPGTGKTMLARIIAHQSGAVFYQIKGPEVVSKWLGQSEEMLRKLFEHASAQKSAILFFDEIDSVAAQRDEDAHESSKRLVAQLLTLMDGFASTANVVVIAATNRPQDIDVALRRPGRFDWEIEFPLPARSDRELILHAGARRVETLDYLPHTMIADRTEGWSGAELSAIWTEAALLAAIDQREAIMAEDYVGGFERVARQREHKLPTTRSRSASEPV